MPYNPRVANIPVADYEALMAIVRSDPAAARPLSDEDRWRRDYEREQRAIRIAGFQADLFGASVVTHYHRHAPGPKVDRPPEPVDAKLDRIKGDRLATFGPLRADRPAFLSRDERTAIARAAANWLRVRQRVRIVDAPGAVDPAFGPERFLGRAGVVWRLCSSTFDDRCYVFLDPVGGERTQKITMVELRDIEPIA
ncbi:hypothetical protein [Sphingomonas sp. 1P08PE]|jgi:hypothetical protein|uniref:hypothetical protein n=1 Tax=Sphingomonas sp. 1P08PE TaxID=554122 RepID=UPI0039A0F21F